MTASKMKSRKSWREKLEKKQERELIPLEGKYRDQFGEGTMLIPRPLDVEAVIRTVPKGKLLTLGLLREHLARQAGATVACPMTTGIFCRIVAEAAAEEAARGAKQVTPYWRVVTDEGRLNPKWPGGIEDLTRKLHAEGHTVVPPEKGKKPPLIKDFAQHLTRLSS